MTKQMKFILTALVCVFTTSAMAQDTNLIRTQIGLFEAKTGTVIVKGIAPVGFVQLGVAQLSLGFKQTKNAGTGEQIYGLILEMEGNQFARESVLIDDEEVTSLMEAVGYLGKITSEVTRLPGFQASYTSKAGFRVLAESVQRDGGISFFVQFEGYPRMTMTSSQMAQFYGLLQQSRKNLDAMKAGK